VLFLLLFFLLFLFLIVGFFSLAGLIWSLIEHYQIKMNASNVEEEVRRASVRLDQQAMQRLNAQMQYQYGSQSQGQPVCTG
jgi:hypothetical protein